MFPTEILDLIIGFGFSCVLTFRLVNKEMKDKIDKMVKDLSVECKKKRYGSFVFSAPTYDLNISAQTHSQILLLNIIREITRITKNKSHTRFTNMQYVTMHGIVFDVCSVYQYQEKIYERLEKLFETTFASCSCSGFCIPCATRYLNFYKCIFSSLRYYTQYKKLTPVDALLEKKFEEAQSRAKYIVHI